MINLDTNMKDLAEVGGFTNNESAAIHNIETNEQAVLWLASCAIQLQPGMQPPTYDASLSSRVANIKGVINYYDHTRNDPAKLELWSLAFSEARELSVEAKTLIKQHLSRLDKLNS